MAYQVTYDYAAANAKELSVKRLDLVDVIEAPPKKQWWKVRREVRMQFFYFIFVIIFKSLFYSCNLINN